jgi:preprotein translocase subunit SecA
MLDEVVEALIPDFIEEKQHPEDWNLKGLDDTIFKQFSLKLNLSNTGTGLNSTEIEETVIAAVKDHLKKKEADFGEPLMHHLMKMIMLQSIDTQWKDHLLAMDHLKEGIGLRGYGQKDPVREYQKEGYDMFMEMIYRIKADTLEKLCLVQIHREEDIEEMQEKQRQDYIMSRGEDTPEAKTVKRDHDKIGRNDPCSCGSGKKYKKCCGK